MCSQRGGRWLGAWMQCKAGSSPAQQLHAAQCTRQACACLSPFRFDANLADGFNASYEEVGVNQAGVAVSSTETIESSEAALAADPLNNVTGVRCPVAVVGGAAAAPEWHLERHSGAGSKRALVQGGSCAVPRLAPHVFSVPPSLPAHAPKQLTEDDVPSVILPLPTATSARTAAAALGELIEEEGSAEGFGILFSDKGGNAWVSGGCRLGLWRLAGPESLGWAVGVRALGSCTALRLFSGHWFTLCLRLCVHARSTWRMRRATTGWPSASPTTNSLCPPTRAASR